MHFLKEKLSNYIQITNIQRIYVYDGVIVKPWQEYRDELQAIIKDHRWLSR